MTYSAKKDSRHITLRPDAMAIYDRWRKEGSAIVNTSQAIIEYDSKTLTLTEADQQWIKDRITEAVHACYKP
jgi:phage gp45-like